MGGAAYMGQNRSVYLAWQAPTTRYCHVVGMLTERADCYTFAYTAGAAKLDKFIPFSGMENLTRQYISKALFPLFKNRVLSAKRPEYPHFIQWLGLDQQDASPVAILERSGGLRGTDKLQVFKRFEIDGEGCFDYNFFAHGLGCLSASAASRVAGLAIGQQLFLCPDPQNSHDEHALIIRAESPAEIIGYCPRFLAKSISILLGQGPDCVQVTVAGLSDDAPANYKLLCKAAGRIAPDAVAGFMADDEFRVLAAT
jgi:hypothetical protein